MNLGQGFPDLPGPDFVKEAAVEAIRADLSQYAISHGTSRLRQAIATAWRRQHGRSPDPEAEIPVGSGATELLPDAMLALVNPGDEVILFEPCYDSYAPDVIMAGGLPRFVRLEPPDWHFDRQAPAECFTPRTKLLLVNTPTTPRARCSPGRGSASSASSAAGATSASSPTRCTSRSASTGRSTSPSPPCRGCGSGP